MARKNTKDKYLIATKTYVMDGRSGAKITAKYINDGWEIISAVPDKFFRSTMVTFRKENPDYQPR